ncbi:hypothetical protein [Tenacibaculum sp. M341]|uniref:hypothetical protein n=1 Tax=Tenacibaculum sp. M341 TaxID=2530339 RepID=UPI001046B848|nr:hypothetical protein [Tenacibaculum sp. M341]TCI90015.1 hypothetical protein EYW44_15225 [Tenacibaculum sp. M341]
MKKYMLLSIVLGVFLLVYSNSPFSYRQLVPFFKKLPKEFKNYKYAREGIDTENLVVEKLIKEGTYEEISLEYYNKKDSTVVIKTQNYSGQSTNNPDVYTNTYYKLNSRGAIIDSLELKEDAIARLYNGYLVNDDSYYTWILDGNKVPKKCEIINRENVFTKREVTQKFKELYAKATVMVNNHNVFYENNSQYVSIFFTDTNCYMLFGDDDLIYTESKEYPDKYQNEIELHNVIEEKNVWNNTNDYIKLLHYQKEGYQKSYSSFFSLNLNGIRSVNKWEGTGYMQLNFRGFTIPFKMNLNYELENVDTYKVPFRGELEFFTNEELSYGLLRYYGNGRICIVKQKQHKNN